MGPGVQAEMDRHGVDSRDWTAHMAAQAVFEKRHPAPLATLAQVADHVEHVRAVAGLSGVGIGGDFDGCDRMPEGLEDVACYPALIGELVDRHWSDAEVAALTRGNILRVLRAAEDAAR